jgi:hypothetical protein
VIAPGGPAAGPRATSARVLRDQDRTSRDPGRQVDGDEDEDDRLGRNMSTDIVSQSHADAVGM